VTVIDGGLGSTEHVLPDKIASQEIMRKAQFDFRRLVKLGDLFLVHFWPMVFVNGQPHPRWITKRVANANRRMCSRTTNPSSLSRPQERRAGSGVYNSLCAICPCRLLAIPHVLMKFASVRALDKPAGQGENQNMAAVERKFERYVTSDPEILGGEPVLVGTRLRLETVLKCYEDGATPEEVFEWYPGASPEVLRRIRSVFRPGVAVSH
jgi:uncharacterized protein (DUF433 family)